MRGPRWYLAITNKNKQGEKECRNEDCENVERKKRVDVFGLWGG